jgi:DNA (cytosine-5)-methyltransferase 1
MNHASLFSGIGGFDLAAEWMGWTNVLHCERDPFCQRVLQYHFPNAKTYNDVKTFDGTEWRGRVDILTGGFPCQPYSSAGKRLGKDDERHLWPEMCRIISEVAPAYVVGENVRGLLNWNGGMVFEEVCADLEAMGYEVWTGLIPAAGVGAPHRRDRIWWVAHYSDSNGTMRRPKRDASESGTQRLQERDEIQWTCQSSGLPVASNADDVRLQHAAQRGSVGASEGEARGRTASSVKAISSERNATDTNCGGLEGTTQSRRDSIDVERKGIFGDATNTDGNQRPEGRMHKARPNKAARHTRPCDARPDTWQNFPTQPPICGGDDGLPRELDGVTFSKWRAESIKAYGNAIVPQVAYQIFQAIQTTHDN